MASFSTFVWEEVSPPAFALKPNNVVLLHLSMAPFELLLQCWSPERVSSLASKSRQEFFKKTPGTPAILHLIQPQSLLIFTTSSMGTSVPGTGACCGGETSWKAIFKVLIDTNICTLMTLTSLLKIFFYSFLKILLYISQMTSIE